MLPIIERDIKKNKYDELSFWWKSPEPGATHLSCKLWYEGKTSIKYLSLGLATYNKIADNNLAGTHMLVGASFPDEGDGLASLTERVFPDLDVDVANNPLLLLSDMNVTTSGREVNMNQSEHILQQVMLTFTLPLDFFENQIVINGDNYFAYKSEEFFGAFRLNFEDVHSEATGYSLDGIMVENCRSDYFEYDFRMNMKMNLKFYWKVEDDYVHVMMKRKGSSWLAWGVSKDEEGKMSGSEVVIAKWSDGLISEGTLKKYRLKGTTTALIEEMEAARQTLDHWSISQQNGETVVRFSKLLHEDGEHRIFASRPTTFVYAVGVSNVFSQHAHAEGLRLELNKCPYTDGNLGLVSSKKRLDAFVAHALFGAVAFAILIPFAICSAWFRDIFPNSWFKYHVYANAAAGGFTIIAFFIAYIRTNIDNSEHFSEPHHQLGLALFIIMTIQLVSGFTRSSSNRKRIPSSLISDPSYYSVRERWDSLHKVFGICILTMGLIQVGSGLKMIAREYNTKNFVPRYIAYVFLLLASVIFLRRWLKKVEIDQVATGNDLELTSHQEGTFVNGSAGQPSRLGTHSAIPNEII